MIVFRRPAHELDQVAQAMGVPLAVWLLTWLRRPLWPVPSLGRLAFLLAVAFAAGLGIGLFAAAP